VLHIIDCSAVYLLIAVSYTPNLRVPLCGGLVWSLFGILCGRAIAGIMLYARKRSPFAHAGWHL
jgi:channel protein (hemolysin III family)